MSVCARDRVRTRVRAKRRESIALPGPMMVARAEKIGLVLSKDFGAGDRRNLPVARMKLSAMKGYIRG